MNITTEPSKRLLRLGQVIVAVVSFIFLGNTLWQNWGGIQNATIDFKHHIFLAAIFLLFIAWSLLPLPTYLTLRSFSVSISYPQAMAAFYSSQMMKYLPGGLWALPGRAIIYTKEHQLNKRRSAFSVTWETVALLAAAILVGSGGLLFKQEALSIDLSLILLLLLVIATGLAFVVLPRYALTTLIIDKQSQTREANPLIGQPDKIRSGFLLQSLGLCVAFWLVSGLGFYYLLLSVLGPQMPYSWHDASAIYAMAWTVGFFVFVAPAGLGVRESALVLLLSISTDQANAVFIAVLGRLWWTIVEGIWIVLGVFLYHIAYHRKSPS